MGGCNGRPIVGFMTAATLALSSLGTPRATLAEDACPPPPPYGVPAYVIDFEWDQPVAVEYGVATRVEPFDHKMPGLSPMLGGDFAVLTAGCDAPIEPLLITRRDQSLGDVDRAEQAAPGVGTYSVCGTGSVWAGMAKSQEVPAQPWTYTIAAVGVRPCEGAYVDSTDENLITTRQQPETTTVTATVTHYSALQTAPDGEPVTLTADVGVVNAKSLDNARFEGGPDPDYQRPSPVVLGTVTLPPIGSSADHADSGADPNVAAGDEATASEDAADGDKHGSFGPPVRFPRKPPPDGYWAYVDPRVSDLYDENGRLHSWAVDEPYLWHKNLKPRTWYVAQPVAVDGKVLRVTILDQDGDVVGVVQADDVLRAYFGSTAGSAFFFREEPSESEIAEAEARYVDPQPIADEPAGLPSLPDEAIDLSMESDDRPTGLPIVPLPSPPSTSTEIGQAVAGFADYLKQVIFGARDSGP